MRGFYLTMGFICGACATAPLSQVIEYTLHSEPKRLVAENGKGIDLIEADGFKCLAEDDLRSIKRYIVDIEQQLIACEKK